MRRVLVALSLAVVAIGLGVVGTVAWYGSGVAMRPPWYEHRTPEQGLRPMDPDGGFFIWHGGYRDPTTDLGLDYELLEMPARDGSTLRGWLVAAGSDARAGIVAVHGGGADRREFLRHVPIFHAAGLPVLLFDCREQGISDGRARGISLGLRESEDVSSAVAFAKSTLGLDRVAVIGTSQGGASVILAAASDPAIDVVIAENAFTSVADLIASARLPDGTRMPSWAAGLIAVTAMWRMDGVDALWRPSPLEAVGDIAPRPLLIMHGSSDEVIPVEQAERLYAAAGQPTELWILDGAHHAALFNHDPDAYRERVIDFLDRYLAPAPAGL